VPASSAEIVCDRQRSGYAGVHVVADAAVIRPLAFVELKGPDCKKWIVPTPWYGPCNVTTHSDIPYYDTKVVECVKRGGPGRNAGLVSNAR
jgi:hypothetical protein